MSLAKRIAEELPARGAARGLTILALAVGGLVAVGLPGLIALALFAAIRS